MKKWNRFLAVAIVLTTAFSPVPAHAAHAADVDFADQGDAASWAQEGIRTVKKLGIIHGDPNGNFRPLDNLTREEFAVLLAKMLQLKGEDTATSSFRDVAVDSWALPAIEKLNKLGYMKGEGDGTFRPEAPISREEVAAILVRALGVDVSGLGSKLSVSDKDRISNWAKDAVQFLYQYDVMKGDGTGFAPQRNAQRQEIAVILTKAMPIFNLSGATTVSAVSDGTVVVDGVTYTVADSLKGLFTQANTEALKGAKIKFEAANQQLTKITYLEITNSGKPAASGKPEFSGNLVLDGGGAQLAGDLKVSGDFLSLKHLQVNGNLEIAKELQNDFYASDLKVIGQTIVNGGDTNTVVFDQSALGALEINKPNVRVEPKNRTTIGNVLVNANAIIQADAGVTIPKMTVADGVAQAEVNATVTALEMTGQNGTTLSGSATIGELTLAGGGTVMLNTTGEIGKLFVKNENARFNLRAGATKVAELILPDGKKASDVVTNYESVKGQIGNGSTNQPAPAPNPTPHTNHKPDAKHIEDTKLYLGKHGAFFAPTDLATDQDADQLQFVENSVSVSANKVVQAKVVMNWLIITPMTAGQTDVKVRVTDGSEAIEVTIHVQVANEEVLWANVVSGGQFPAHEAAAPAIVHLDQLDEAGKHVPDLDLTNLQIKIGTNALVKDQDYTVDETTDTITISQSYLNGLTEGQQMLTLTNGNVYTEVLLEAFHVNHRPTAKHLDLTKIYLGTQGATFAVADLATDSDEDKLDFVPDSVSVSTTGVVDAKLEMNQLVITPKAIGQAMVTVRVTDGTEAIEVAIPVQVAQGEALTAQLQTLHVFREHDAGTEAIVHVDKTDKAGQDVADLDLTDLVIMNGTHVLVKVQDYHVDEAADDIAIDLSYLNGLPSGGSQFVTLSYGNLSADVEFNVLPADADDLAAVQLVNDATDVPGTRNAIESDALHLQLTPYYYLSDRQRNKVAQSVLDGKGIGYLTRMAIQDAVDQAVRKLQIGGDEASAVAAVNDAATVDEMLEAIASPLLHLDHADYEILEDYEREIVAHYLLDHKGESGYANRDTIQNAFTTIVKEIIDDWKAIVDDLLAIDIGFAEGDSFGGVKNDINLPTVGAKHGASITWFSDKPEVISNDGKVNRPDNKNETVTLTVILNNRWEHLGVTVDLTVIGYMNGLYQSVSPSYQFTEKSAGTEVVYHLMKFIKDVPTGDLDLSNLVVQSNGTTLVKDTDYTVDEETDQVALNLSYLNTLALGEHTITFINGSDKTDGVVEVLPQNQAVLAAIRAVNQAKDVASTRHALETAQLGLQLTPYSYLSSWHKDEVAQAVLSAKGTGYESRSAIQDAVDQAVNQIQIGGDETGAVQEVNEATTVEEMLAALASPKLHLDHPDYSGMEDYERDNVAQYLIDQRGAGYATRDEIQAKFVEIIQMILEDWNKIVEDVKAIELGYAAGDSAKSVTQDILMPTTGVKNGATIVWKSDNAAIITDEGHVTRPAQDTVVKLSAHLTNRYEKLDISINVLVMAAVADQPTTVKDQPTTVTDPPTAVWTVTAPEVVQVAQTGSNDLNVLSGTKASDLLAGLQAFSGQGTVKVYLDSTQQQEAAADAVLTNDMVIVATSADGSSKVIGKLHLVDAVK